MKDCLRALGTTNITSVNSGAQAIEEMQMIAKDPRRSRQTNIDVIFSDWHMEGVDGMLLLRWVRHHRDSPNRFLPFVMISAYSEAKLVLEARNMGVTEFLTKPFTTAAFVRVLLHIINKPRQFIQTADFFGPDRRRNKEQYFRDVDRRLLTEDSPEVEIIHA